MSHDDTSCAHEKNLRTLHHVRVAVPASIAHTLIAPALPRFLEQHRAMRVHLVIAEEASKLGRCDAAIGMQPVESHLQSHAWQLAVVPHLLCASEEFLSLHGRPKSPYEVNSAHCIGVLDENFRPRSWSFRRGSAELTLVPAAPLMFSDAQSAVLAAVRGGGLILVPALAAEAQIAAGLLTPLLLDWRAPRFAIWMQHTGPLTAQLKTFAEFVADLFPRERDQRAQCLRAR